LCPLRSLVRFFWLFCCNNPDLVFFFFLVVASATTSVAVVPAAEDSRRAGSEAHLVLELQVRPLSSLCVVSHRGGGGDVGRSRSSSLRRLESSSSSPTLVERRWRLLKPCGGGGRWPAVSSPAATFLAERRPNYFLPAMMPFGRQFSDWLVAMASRDGSCVAPSGAVPRRRRSASRLETEDLIAFQIFCMRSFLQSPRTTMYFLFSVRSCCNMCCYPVYE
jgi:hypothetical protein